MNMPTLKMLQERAKNWNPEANSFSELVDNYLSLTGKTQRKLADELGIDPSTVSRWLAGQVPTKVHERALIGVILGGSPTATASTGKKKPTLGSQPRNHVLFCLDSSGSMVSYRDAVVEAFNSSLAQVKERSTTEKQITSASLWTFGEGYGAVTQKFFNESLEWLRPLNAATYVPQGQTPLFDCVGEAIEKARALPDANDSNVSFLLLVQTDGVENYSTKHNAFTLNRLISEVQGTDRWTIAFMVPPGKADWFARSFGIARGNIREWEASERGARDVGVATVQGIGDYFRSRTLGATSTKNFYTTDLSKVKPSDLKKLNDVRAEVTALKVPREASIKDFVEAETGSYKLGSAFYQLTKDETIQRNKEILVKEKTKGAIYWGPDARSLLGIPAGDVKVKPGNHANYDIFVQSTSTNRKLVRGTTLLVMK